MSSRCPTPGAGIDTLRNLYEKREVLTIRALCKVVAMLLGVFLVPGPDGTVAAPDGPGDWLRGAVTMPIY